MSKKIDKIRETEKRRQLLFIPVAIAILFISVGLYAFQFSESIKIGSFYLWGVSKYVWTLCLALFACLPIAAVANIISMLATFWRARNIPGAKINSGVVLKQVFKYLTFAALSSLLGIEVSYFILEEVSEINSFLTIDSVMMEMIAFYAWMMLIFFIFGMILFFVVGAVRAPFEYIKDNQIMVDYSANDGGGK